MVAELAAPPELGTFPTVRLDRRSGIPIYVQLKTQLEYAIATEKVPDNTRLPSVRGLASQLGIAVETVRQAYVELEQQGLVTTRHGAGTFTSLPAVEHGGAAGDALLVSQLDAFLEGAFVSGAPPESLGRLVAHRLRLLEHGPVTAFVGVRPSVERYARQVAGSLPDGLTSVHPVAIEDVRAARVAGSVALPPDVTHVVCLAFHARELQDLLADSPVRVVPIVSGLARPVARTIAALPATSRMLLVCREESRPIYEDFITPLRPQPVLPSFAPANNRRAISHAAGDADVILHSTVAGDLVRRLILRRADPPQLIELVHEATDASLGAAASVVRADWDVALRLQRAAARAPRSTTR